MSAELRKRLARVWPSKGPLDAQAILLAAAAVGAEVEREAIRSILRKERDFYLRGLDKIDDAIIRRSK